MPWAPSRVLEGLWFCCFSHAQIKLVGHIMAAPAKPLPPDMEAFVAGAGEAGAVLISLGTNAQFGAHACCDMRGSCHCRRGMRSRALCSDQA